MTRQDTQAAGSSELAVDLRAISKTFQRGGAPVPVLEGLVLQVAKGAFEALMGPSGSGKSTVLNLIAGLERPTSGQVIVAGTDLGNLNRTELARFRARHIGFIFQAYNLIPVLTAVENVELPLTLQALPAAERRRRAETALRAGGLADRMQHLPKQLSGGQEQRVAIARAIVADPTLLVCDEPTGDLDRASADAIVELLGRLHREFGKTILVVTHDPLVAERASVTRRLDKGKLAEDSHVASAAARYSQPAAE